MPKFGRTTIMVTHNFPSCDVWPYLGHSWRWSRRTWDLRGSHGYEGCFRNSRQWRWVGRRVICSLVYLFGLFQFFSPFFFWTILRSSLVTHHLGLANYHYQFDFQLVTFGIGYSSRLICSITRNNQHTMYSLWHGIDSRLDTKLQCKEEIIKGWLLLIWGYLVETYRDVRIVHCHSLYILRYWQQSRFPVLNVWWYMNLW